MDTEKYDRQIRLIGFEAQNKICHLRVKIAGSVNFISAEILKNLTLLGIQNIYVKNELVEFTKKLVPDDLVLINENLNLVSIDENEKKIVTESNENVEIKTKNNETENQNSIDFVFSIDSEPKKGYFICSRCYLVLFKDEETHFCDKPNADDVLKIARECLLGAFVVQEFLKYIQGKEFAKKHDFSTIFC